MLLPEAGQPLADPILVARDDGRVRDRQSKRLAKQGRHREPIRQAADNPGLRGRAQHQDPITGLRHEFRKQKNDGHENKRQRRQQPRPPRLSIPLGKGIRCVELLDRDTPSLTQSSSRTWQGIALSA